MDEKKKAPKGTPLGEPRGIPAAKRSDVAAFHANIAVAAVVDVE